MAMTWFPVGLMAILAYLSGNVISCSGAPAPAPGPTNDGNAIDQGVACVLMVVALVLTYLIHLFDASYSFF